MSARLVIAALTGAVIGLLSLAFLQARRLGETRRQLELAARTAPELPLGTNQRPLRLRLQSLPPINIKTEVQELDWRTIESPDYTNYVANLRRIGCPEETIRDIILADVNKLYTARRRALRASGRDWEFWRHPDERRAEEPESEAERERDEALASLERERRQLIASLLGESDTNAQLAAMRDEAMEDRDLQFLDPDKRQAVADALAQWRLALEAAENSPDAAESGGLRAAANQALEQALAGAMTPAEREQYELRASPLAGELRERLRGFGASREEFEELFRLESAVVDEQNRLAEAGQQAVDGQLDEKLDAVKLERDQKIREVLGPQRYADFQRSNDPDYQTLFSLAIDHAMPSEVANQVWSMRSEVEAQTERIRENPLLTAEQKVLALRAIRNETQSAIVDVLGEPLLRAYQREGGGWLVDLTETANLGESGTPIVAPPLPELPPARPEQAGAFPIP